MTRPQTTADVVYLLDVLRAKVNERAHLTLAPPLDDEQVANEMRLEQAAEARKDDRAWGRNVRVEFGGAS